MLLDIDITYVPSFIVRVTFNYVTPGTSAVCNVSVTKWSVVRMHLGAVDDIMQKCQQISAVMLKNFYTVNTNC